MSIELNKAAKTQRKITAQREIARGIESEPDYGDDTLEPNGSASAPGEGPNPTQPEVKESPSRKISRKNSGK